MGRRPLTKEQELDLVRRAKRGDRRAQRDLLKAFEGFLWSRVRPAAKRLDLDADDLFQEAAGALLDTVKRFDPARGYRFSTYLRHRIRGAITKAYRQEFRDDVGNSAYLKAPKALKVPKRPPKTVILDEPACSYWPLVAVEHVKKLPRRNDRLIASRLWFTDPPWTQAEIARDLGISRSAVTQRRKHLEGELQRRFGRLFFGKTQPVKRREWYRPRKTRFLYRLYSWEEIDL